MSGDGIDWRERALLAEKRLADLAGDLAWSARERLAAERDAAIHERDEARAAIAEAQRQDRALDGERFDSDAGEGLTVREYLFALLETLWREGEGFSGKRPFGNSCWELDLYAPLVRGGFIEGRVDEDGYALVKDYKAAHAFVAALIRSLASTARVP